jgi:hypothetical protein
MAMFGYGLSQSQILSLVQQGLLAHRNGLEAVKHLHDWSSGVATADLVALGFSTGDANSILAAIADGYAEYQIHLNGQAPSTYPQVTGTPYVYTASQSAIIGPVQP